MTMTELPGPSAPAAGPSVRHTSRRYLLTIIRRQGGEWTVGRAKPVLRRFFGSHVYRATIRTHLRWLRDNGHLIEHGRGTSRIYYTVTPEGEDQ